MGVDGGSSRSASSCRSPPPPTTTPSPGRSRPGPFRDAVLVPLLLALWKHNYSVYGRRKLTKAAQRAGIDVGRDQVARLMAVLGIEGATRAKKRFTTKADPAAVRAPDLVKRNFTASRPDDLWVADFTYCSTWSGIVYVAFIIDVYSRRLVGWKAARSMTADLVVDASNMAAWTRRNTSLDGLVCHTDAGSQYTSIAYTERLADIGAAPSIGTVGDSYDNAMAEIGHGSVQDRTAPQPGRPRRQRRTLEGTRRPRDRHLRLGLVVQRGAPPLRARRLHPRRVRGRLPSQVSAHCGMRNRNTRASVKPRPVQCRAIPRKRFPRGSPAWWIEFGSIASRRVAEACQELVTAAGFQVWPVRAITSSSRSSHGANGCLDNTGSGALARQVVSVGLRAFQGLPEEVAAATGWKVRQLAERLVADGLVEPRGLKAERVQPCSTAPSEAGLSLDGGHEVASDPLTSHIVVNPEMTHVQPSPVGVSVDTPKHFVITADKDAERFAIL